MKGLTIGFASLFLGVLMLFAPRPAQAQNPIDCSKGCVIVTCNASSCTVWQCDAEGCSVIGRYFPRDAQKPQAKAGAKAQAPRAFDAVCHEDERCAIKVCAGGACRVSLFDGVEFRPIARVEDIGAVIDDAAGKLRGRR